MGAGPGHVFPNASTLGRGMKAWEEAGTRGGKGGTAGGGVGHVGVGGGGSGANAGKCGKRGRGAGRKRDTQERGRQCGKGAGPARERECGRGTGRARERERRGGTRWAGEWERGGGPGGPGSGSAKRARAFATAIGPVPIETPPLFRGGWSFGTLRTAAQRLKCLRPISAWH